MDHRLIGRHDECRQLLGLLTRADQRTVVLAGSAGLGKSRLAAELVAAAETGGWTVVRARGFRSAATIPLGAFAHLLPDDPGRAGSRLELLHESVGRLTQLAAGGRLLVVVDDAHYLDDASATLTHLIATTSTAATLVTVRTETPSPDPVAALWIEGHADRIELAPLPRREADELVEVLLDGAVARATLAELWRLTRGNALLTVETVRGARESGALRHDGGIWHHTGPLGGAERLAAVIDSRLAHLGDEDRAALELLAVGEPVPLDVVERAVDTDRLAALERDGLAEVQSGTDPPSVRTLHPLYGEVLRDRMPRTRVRAASRLLADALEAIGVRRRDDLFRLALWRLEAGDEGDPEVLAAAARQAVLLFEHDLAERLARAALDAGAGDDARLALAEALSGLGRAADAEAEFGRAEPAATTGGLAAVAVPRAWNLAVQLGDERSALEVLQKAAAAAEDLDAADEIVAVEATIRSFLGDLTGALDASGRILARDDASERTVLQALTIHTIAATLLGRPATALPDIERGLALAERLGATVPLAETKLRSNRSFALELHGRLLDAERLARTDYVDALERDARHEVAALGVTLSFVLLSRGRISESERVAAESLIAAGQADPLAVEPAGYCAQALARAIARDLTGAEALLADHDRRYPAGHRFGGYAARARGWIDAQRGRIDAAVTQVCDGGHAFLAAGQPGWAAWPFHDAVRFGRAEVVVDELGRLAGEVEGQLVPALAAHARAAAHGQATRVEEAAKVLAELGADLVAAEAFAAAATAHRREGREEAARRADRHSRRLARNCAGARSPGLSSSPADLTARQREIAHLAAARLTNREIGQRLGISTRTVDNHLAQVYVKLGIEGRRALAVALGPQVDGHDDAEGEPEHA